MDAVEIFLLCVVGLSVLVFLILENLDSPEESRKSRHESGRSVHIYGSESKARLGSSAVESERESNNQREKRCVGADGEAEQEEVSENIKFGGIREIAEETENQVYASCGGNMEASEGSGEGEEEFIDDWEGIERTELEKLFGEAVVFVNCKSNEDQIADVKLQLYGLQKVALEGPCHRPQPMALKLAARSKWNAWQKLGNMSREMAMGKYIDILSNAIPGWKGEGALPIQAAGTCEDLTSTQQNYYGAESER